MAAELASVRGRASERGKVQGPGVPTGLDGQPMPTPKQQDTRVRSTGAIPAAAGRVHARLPATGAAS